MHFVIVGVLAACLAGIAGAQPRLAEAEAILGQPIGGPDAPPFDNGSLARLDQALPSVRYVFEDQAPSRLIHRSVFDLVEDTWEFKNPQTRVNPGGTCFGVNVLHAWWYVQRVAPHFSTPSDASQPGIGGTSDRVSPLASLTTQELGLSLPPEVSGTPPLRLRTFTRDPERATDVLSAATRIHATQDFRRVAKFAGKTVSPSLWQRSSTILELSHEELFRVMVDDLATPALGTSEVTFRLQAGWPRGSRPRLHHSLLVTGLVHGTAIASPPAEPHRVEAYKIELWDPALPLSQRSDVAEYRRKVYLLYFPTQQAFGFPGPSAPPSAGGSTSVGPFLGYYQDQLMGIADQAGIQGTALHRSLKDLHARGTLIQPEGPFLLEGQVSTLDVHGSISANATGRIDELRAQPEYLEQLEIGMKNQFLHQPIQGPGPTIPLRTPRQDFRETLLPTGGGS